MNGTCSSHSLKVSQPGVSNNGPNNRGEGVQSHKGVIDGGGQVIVPVQGVLKVQHQDGCGQSGKNRGVLLQPGTESSLH